MTDQEISKVLNTAVELQPMSIEHERIARYTIRLLIPAVKKLIEDAVRDAKIKSAASG